jgi:hypothetical protein
MHVKNAVAAAQYDYFIDEIHQTYSLDLSRMVDGLYTIEYNGQSTTRYCAKASFIRRIPLLILEVFVGADVSESYQIVQRHADIQSIDPKEFHLHFGNYYYFWRYRLIPINTPLPTVLKIRTDQSEYSFTPEQTAIDCHRSPILFTSEQLIDTPNDDLTINLYLVNSSDSSRELIGPLPKTEEVEYTLTTEDGKTYAQMILYLVYEKGRYVIKKEYENPVPPVGSFTVVYTQFDWGNGSGATINVTIKNTGTIAVNGWTLRFSFPGNQRITSLWRGVYTQIGAAVTVTNEYYNGHIAAGGSETFGFNLSYSGTNTTPTNFVVNGIPAPNANSTMVIDNFIVSYNTRNDWYNSLVRGATVEVTLKNNGTNAVNGWRLAFSFPGDQKITNLWCGDYTQNGANVTVANETFNSLIAVGESVKFGFNISYRGINNIPTSFTVFV